MSSYSATHRERGSCINTSENHPISFFLPWSNCCNGLNSASTSHVNKNQRVNYHENQLRTLDRLFDQINNFNHFPHIPCRTLSTPLENNSKNNFVKKDGQYECEIPIQHDMIDNLQINEKNRVIRLNATKEITEKKNDNNNKYSFKSSSISSWSHSLLLPKNAVENSTVASYQDGKLKLTAQINQ